MKFPVYELAYCAFIYPTMTYVINLFPGFSHVELRSTSTVVTNNNFSNLINCNFYNFIVVYTDSSVSPLSVGYSFYIPEFHMSFTSNLSPSSSSFTAECFTIIEALNIISTLQYKTFLTATDLLSCLQSLNSFSFKFHISPLVLRIKSILFSLGRLDFNIQFLWISSHADISSNEIAYTLANTSSNFLVLPFHIFLGPTSLHYYDVMFLNFGLYIGIIYQQISPLDSKL